MAAAFISLSSGAPGDVLVPAGADLMVVTVIGSDAVTRTGATADGVALSNGELDNDFVAVFYRLAPAVGETLTIAITPGTNITTVAVAFYSTDTAAFTFQSGQEGSLASDSYSPSGAAVITHGISAVTTSHTPVASTNERLDSGGAWYGDRIVTGAGSVTVGVTSATDPDYAGAIFTETTGASLTASAAFAAQSATMAVTAARGHPVSVAFAAQAATMAVTADRRRGAVVAFAAQSATMAVTAGVTGNRTASVAFAAGSATMAVTATRVRTATVAFAAQAAAFAVTATRTGVRSATVAFVAQSASFSVTVTGPSGTIAHHAHATVSSPAATATTSEPHARAAISRPTSSLEGA